MEKEDFEKFQIVGYRKTLALILKSKFYDILMIFLIIVYTLLIFIFIGLEDLLVDENGDDLPGVLYFIIIEMVILGIFSLEITLHIIAYHGLYLKDVWNVFDLIVIVLSIAMVILDT
jgi:hypothetical protein